MGTGSILASCAYFNSFCFGSDLDVRVLKGYAVGNKSKNWEKIKGIEKIERYDVFANFHHYGLPIPEIMCMDVSQLQITSRGHLAVFDAIVCDPPYGVRARSKKIGIRKNKIMKPKKLTK